MAALAARVSKQRAAAEGLGSNQKAVKYLGQDFQTLRQQCLDSGVLFKDPEFPACPSALGYQDLGPRSPQARGIVWKRPTELCPSPQFIIGGAKRTDICQGALGDCWLLAAIASLTLNEELLYRVVPRDQDFQDNYAGIFHFQFWQYGEWVEVVVDDRLPTKDGKLLFLHSEEGSEFWSALLEKAYAKLNGSYEALAGGSTVEGFEDFTGGISEFYDLKKPPASLYQIIWKALRSGSLLACSIDVSQDGFSLLPHPHVCLRSHIPGLAATQYCSGTTGLIKEGPDGETSIHRRFPAAPAPPSPAPGTRGWVSSAAEAEAITSQKLVKSHAYSITGVEEVDSRGRPERLIRLRNPWGEVEWTGAWSDNAPEWNYIAPRQKEELYKKVEDGEFWMSFSDFLRQFSRLEICNLSPDSLSSKEVHKWNLVLFNGRWTRGCTAGGCQNYPATYWTNPQFEIRLDEVDDHQEEGAGEPCCTVLLGLMQKNRRRQKRMGQGMLSIGYAVYKREGPAAAQLGRDFFQGRQPSARSATYVNLREVSARVRLPPGPYVVVPATFEPFKDGDFCLRVFSEKKAKALEIGDVVAGNPHEPHPCEVDQEDGQFERLFEKLAGKDSEVSASELKTALNEVFSKRTDIKFDGFDINTCREMISLMDSNGMGSLGLVEFKTLWLKIQKYLEIYREMDYNHLGTIDAHEMRAALKKAGFTLNNQVQQTIATRYAGSKLGVDFDGFVACMIRLETLFKLFRLLDKDQSGIVRLSLAEWLCCALV
ncbi:calpain-8 isoform X2 [Camelus ferus]|uniref:Calpain-2 catalytic subunit n=1 Tax=Camelus ferus TaxID=419612 RepID=A0A8B8RX41_CAMFR|nr:calpain-8 isoform X2 [Camelus ferus]